MDYWRKEVHREYEYVNPKDTFDDTLEMLEIFHEYHTNISGYKLLEPPEGIIESKEKYNDLESPYLINIGEAYPVYGKIDRLVQWENKTWALDYKITSNISQFSYYNYRDFNMCLETGLLVLAGSILNKSSIEGIILELLSGSSTNNYLGFHHIRVREHWLEDVINYSRTLINQIEKCNKSKQWARNVSGCTPYGMFGKIGNECEFFPICEANDWRRCVQNFEQRNYDPLEGLNVRPLKNNLFDTQ